MRPPCAHQSGTLSLAFEDLAGQIQFRTAFYRRSAFLLTTTLAFLIATGSAHAQNVTYTWQNANGTWTNTTTAWLGSNGSTTGPQLSATTNNTDTALFSNIGSGNNTVSLTSNRTVYGLVFSSTANAYTFTASNRALDIMSGGGLVNNSTQVQTFNMLVQNANGNGQWSSVAGGSLLFNSGVSIGTTSTNRTLTLAGAGTITVNSTIANGGTAIAGAITVTSNGSTILSGNNTYGGVTTMNSIGGGTLTLSGNNSGAAGGVTLTAGTLNINNANALGTGALTNSAGVTIANTSGAAITNLGNNAITLNDFTFGTANSTSSSNLDLGTGNVTMSASRVITFAGTNTTLSMGFGNITNTSSGRTLTANGAGNTLVLRGLSLSQNATVAVTGTLAGSANIRIDGAIVPGTAFAHGVTITNTGTTTFNGTNTYTGSTTVSAGATLQIGNGSTSGSLAVASAIINNANLVFNRSDTLTQGTDFNGTISGTGSVIQVGSGTLTLSGANTFTGGLTIKSGTLLASTSNSALGGTTGAGAVTLGDTSGSANATLAINNFDYLNPITVAAGSSGARTISATGTNPTLGGGITLNNTLILSANSTTTLGIGSNSVVSGLGALVVNSASTGIVSFGANNTFGGGFTLNSGIVKMSANNVLGTSTVTLNGGVLATNNTNARSLSNNLTVGGDFALGQSSGGTGNVTLSGAIDLGAATRTITVDNAASTISGVISNGGLTKAGAGNLTLSGINTYTGATVINAGTLQIGSGSTAGSLAVASAITNNATLAFNRSNTITQGTDFNGAIAGTGSLIQAGSGTVVLNGTNTYTGATMINAGTLSIASITNGGVAGALGNSTNAAGNLVLGGGTLLFTGASGSTDRNFTLTNGTSSTINVTTALVISGSGATTNGSLTKAGAGILTLSGNNTYTGSTTASAGTLQLAKTTSLYNGTTASWTASSIKVSGGGTLALNVGGTGEFSTANITTLLTNLGGANGGTSGGFASGSFIGFDTTNAAGNSFTVSDLIADSSGSGGGVIGLTKLGTNTLVLSGANTYTGNTTVSAGTLQITNATALGGTTGGTTVASGATLAISGGLTVLSENITLSGSGVGGGGALRSASGSNTINSTTSGITLIADTTIGSDAGSTLTITRSTASPAVSAGNFSLTLVGAGDFVIDRQIALGTGGLTMNGTGLFTMGAQNSSNYSGNTTINSGTLRLGSNNRINDVSYLIVNGGVFDVNTRTETVAGVTLAGGSITSSTGVLTSNANYDLQNGTISAILAGTVGANKTTGGTVTLSGNNTFSGGVNLSAGQLNINHAAATGNGTLTINGGTLDNTSAAAITLSNNNAQNWNGDFAFTGTKDLNLGNGSVTMNSARTVTVSGGNLTVGGVIAGSGFGLTKNGIGNLVLTGANTYNGATVINAGTLQIGSGSTTGGLAVSSAITNNGTLTFNRSDTLTQGTDFNSTISGTGNVIQAGSGSLILNGSNAYTGNTTISAGVLNIQHASALGAAGTGTTVASGAALQLQGGISVGAEALSLSGSGVSSDGALRNISGTNSYAGAISLGAAARINSDADSLTLSGGITGAQNLSIGGSGNTTISNSIATSTGTLTKDGIGTLTLSANNTYTGATTLSAGTLALSGGLNGSNITISGGSMLNQTSTGVIAGGSATLAVSSGTATLAGNNTFAGGTTLNTAGTLNINHAYALGSGSLITTGGTIDNTSGGAITLATTNAQSWNGTITFLGTNDLNLGTGAVTMSATRIVSVNPGNLTIGGVIGESSAGYGLTKNGSGTLFLTGNNTYTGATTINAGTLNVAYLNNSNVSGPLGNTTGNSKLQFGDGTLQYTGSNATASDRGFRIIGNATFDASGNGSGATMSLTKTGSVDSLFSGNKILTLTGSNTGSNIISATMGDNSSINTLAVVKSGVGTWVMSGGNTYTGSTTISAGTLQIGSGSTSGALSASSAITNNGTLAFNRGSGSTITQGTDFNSTISGTGNLIQAGNGTLVLNGANTYTGATAINAGTLSLASITNGGVAGALGSSTSAASNLVLGGGTLLYTGADGTTDRNFTLTDGTSSTINVTTALTISGSAATTSGNLTKAGAGTLTLSGNNTHTGATMISAGTLALSGGLNGSNVTP